MTKSNHHIWIKSTVGLATWIAVNIATPMVNDDLCGGAGVCLSVSQANAKGGIKKIFNKHAKGINKSIKGMGAGGQKFKMGEKGKLSKIFNGKSGAGSSNAGTATFKGKPGQFKLGQNGKLTKVFNKQASGQTASQSKTSQIKFKLGDKGKLTKIFNGAKTGQVAASAKSPTKFKLGEKGKLTKTFNTQSGAQPPKSPPPSSTKFKLGEKGKLTPIFNKSATPK